MRIVNGVLAVVLVLFAAVQYNDPDGILWGAAYGLGALWCGLSALRPEIYARPGARFLCLASLASAVLGMILLWPDTPRWWMEEVWWVTETAREGMGLMILTAAMLAAAAAALSPRRG
jgi:hypothetical protein